MFEWTWVFQTLDSLTLGFGTPFKELGLAELPALGAIVLLVCCMKWALLGAQDAQASLVKFVGLYSLAYAMLSYYDQPAWFLGGNDFKHVIPDTATYLANVIENSRYDQALQRIAYLLDHLETPNLNVLHGVIDAHAIVAYALVEASMILFGSLLLLPIGTSFIALAVGSLFWPVFIPWVLVPGVSWLFWNPLSYIIKYSFYRPFAIALTYVLAGICEKWIDSALTLDLHTQIAGVDTVQYSLAQFSSMTLIGLVFLVLMALFMAIWELANMIRDFFGGGAGAGSNFLGSMAAFMR